MPYAANNQISTDYIEGGIEITEEQYSEALQEMINGKVVTIYKNEIKFVDDYSNINSGSSVPSS